MFYRWCSPNQDNNNYYGPNLSSRAQYKNSQQLQSSTLHRLNKPQYTRPTSHYIVRPPPIITRERPHSSYMPMPARVQPIPPRNGIPVGWGHVDLNTVYHEHYTGKIIIFLRNVNYIILNLISIYFKSLVCP